MRALKIVLKNNKRMEFSEVGIQSKDGGRVLAVFDRNYRIVAEFLLNSIDTIEQLEPSVPTLACSAK
jgi:hypothetical protein